MNIYLITIGLLFLLLRTSGFTSKKLEEWSSYKTKYGKVYKAEEDKKRLHIYLNSKRRIKSHNYKYAKGLKPYKMEINQYADLTFAELKKTNDNKSIQNSHNSRVHIPLKNIRLPATVDWREKGAVSRVKDQRGCVSGDWAFSVTGSLESQYFLKSGKLVSLSEQNLIDCSSTSNTCNNGSASQAFEYIKNNGGIDTEESYHYNGEDGICSFNRSTIGATVSNYFSLPAGDESALQFAVAALGPISAQIFASGEWMYYRTGIFHQMPCPNQIEDLNHYVLVIGYGSENGTDYWLVKNSWSDKWGEGGYIKMARNKNNACGIVSNAIYPEV